MNKRFSTKMAPMNMNSLDSASNSACCFFQKLNASHST